MQKIRIIGFLFENSLHWQFEVENKIYKRIFDATYLVTYK